MGMIAYSENPVTGLYIVSLLGVGQFGLSSVQPHCHFLHVSVELAPLFHGLVPPAETSTIYVKQHKEIHNHSKNIRMKTCEVWNRKHQESGNIFCNKQALNK